MEARHRPCIGWAVRCLSADQLAAYVAGHASSEDAAEIDAHVDRCEACRASIGATVRASRTVRGRQLGRYVVLDELGSGGMGIVYRAFDPELGRNVALKLLRRERLADPQKAGTRLAREARALAALSHPNVVVVHDLGTAGEEVFVAMELVPGTTLRQWLVTKPRDVHAIVHAFVQAGRGLAAAHAANLVHRDFKPENVLVRDDGRVQVTDFGLARLVTEPAEQSWPDDAAPVALTHTGAMIGTVAYMSPEQLRGEPANAKTDQFSFAVALHEAVCGERPFAGQTVHELRAAMRRPATASRLPAWLRPAVRRGLALDPAERFPTMDELVAALARDPRKVRRRVAAGIALAAVASTTTAIVVTGLHHGEVCATARPRLAHVWDDARKRAVHEAFAATGRPFAGAVWSAVEHELDAYATDWVTAAHAACEATRVNGTQSEALLDLRGACLDRRLASLGALADVFEHADAAVVENAVTAVARLPSLAPCADKATLQAVVKPPEDAASARRVDALRGQLARAAALEAAGKPTDAAAIVEPAARVALQVRYPAIAAEALLLQGTVEVDREHFDAAQPLLVHAGDLAEAGRADELKAAAWTQLVRAASQSGHFAEAHEDAAHGAAVLARLGPGHDDAAAELASVEGAAYTSEGDYGRALELQQRALALREKLHGPDSAQVGGSLSAVGNVLLHLSRNSDALAAYERSRAIRVRALGPHHPDVAASDNNLATVYMAMGRFDDARARLVEAKQISDEVFGPTSARSARILGNLAVLYKDEGRYGDAIETGTRAIALEEAALGADHPMVATLVYVVGASYLELGDIAHAEPALQHALAIRRARLGDDHAEVLATERALGRVAMDKGDLSGALTIFDQVLAAQERTLGADAFELSETHSLVALVLRVRGDHQSELAHLERALAIDEKALGPEHPNDVADLVGIGAALISLHDVRRAVDELERAIALADKLGDVPPATRGDACFALATAIWQTGGDRMRAVTLARSAREMFAASGPLKANELRTVERWLQTHDRAR